MAEGQGWRDIAEKALSDFGENAVEKIISKSIDEIAKSLGFPISKTKETALVVKSFVSFHVLKGCLDLLGVATSGMQFSTDGAALAVIKAKLEEINKKVDLLLSAPLKSARSYISDAIIHFQNNDYEEAYRKLILAEEKSTEGFHLANDDDSRITPTSYKIFTIIMVNSWSKEKTCFLAFDGLTDRKRNIIGQLIESDVKSLMSSLRGHP